MAKLIRRRDRIHKKWRKTTNPALLKEFKSLKCLIQRRLQRQFWSYVEELIVEPEDEPDQFAPPRSSGPTSSRRGLNTQELPLSKLTASW
jgi:hypothetical protein